MNIFEGKTQIETWEIDRIKSLTRRNLVRHVDFPYDIDPWTNLTDAWGHPLTWLWPWGQANGDGMHFEKNEAVEDGSVWPPDHKDQGPKTVEETRKFPRTLGYMRYRPQQAAPTHENDFYNRDQWQNYEGERISDFGVDVETETDISHHGGFGGLALPEEGQDVIDEPTSEDVPLGVLLGRALKRSSALENNVLA
jgi:palmitoyltransferase